MSPTEVSGLIDAPAQSLPDACFSPDGFRVVAIGAVLDAFGVERAGLHDAMPEVVNAGVDSAPDGVIQDPAGVAIGTGHRPAGAGASGQIYGRFPDLAPIPRLGVCSAILNATAGAGRRVLHTHAPQLRGRPSSGTDRTRVLIELGACYANAVVAVHHSADTLGDDARLLNLVPVSASIFAGAFANPAFRHPHLDPSYTLTAIALGIASARARGAALPQLRLYVFERDVCEEAQRLVAQLRAALA